MKWYKKHISRLIYKFIPSLEILQQRHFLEMVDNRISKDSYISSKAKIDAPYKLDQGSSIGDYSYVSINSRMKLTTIGKFCSIGPNLVSGWGIHPLNGVSTSPMFYSTQCRNGTTLSKTDKVEEQIPIKIGNDVFIGANVTILDGVTIGDGAVIGAGAVVSKDIPPYAIAVGSPIKILRYRFQEDTISKLLKLKWWDMDESNLPLVEQYFFDVEKFIVECEKNEETNNHNS